MKIVFLIHRPQARGQEIFAAQLGNQLIQMGHEVTLISLYHGYFELKFSGVHINLGFTHSYELWIPFGWKKFTQIIRQINPDILQANGGDTLKLASLSVYFFSFPGQLVFNNGGVLGYYLDSRFKQIFYRFLLKQIDAAVSISLHGKEDLAKKLPDTCPQFHIPVGIPSNRKFSLSPGPNYPVFVHIGGFTAEKNHRELIHIFSQYLKDNPLAQLWMIGDGPGRETIEKAVQTSQSESFRFLGALNDPWKYVPQNAILVMTSLVEGMPAVLAEAMMAKIPTIAYSVGGLPEMSARIPTISLIESGDQTGFLQAMAYWSGAIQKDIQAELDESSKMARHRFDMENKANQFLEVYRGLCG